MLLKLTTERQNTGNRLTFLDCLETLFSIPDFCMTFSQRSGSFSSLNSHQLVRPVSLAGKEKKRKSAFCKSGAVRKQ